MRLLFYFLLFLLPPVLAFLPASDSGDAQPPALVTAAEQGDLHGVDELLADLDTPDLRDNCDWTPLMKAALNGHDEIVRRLLAHGAEVDAEDKGGYTALMLAASNNHYHIVEQLIATGAEINHRERTRGWTALGWSLRQGHDQMATLLKAYGAVP